MKRILQYLLKGVLYSVPIFVTIYVIKAIFNFLNESIENLGIEGGILSVAVGLVAIALVGFLTDKWLFARLFRYIDWLISKTPLAGSVYSTVKEVISALIGGNSSFKSPVMVRIFEDKDVYQMGFLSDHVLDGLPIAEDEVAVYIPHSFAMSGQLWIVKQKNVMPIDKPSSEVMKYVVSGGITRNQQPVVAKKKK